MVVIPGREQSPRARNLGTPAIKLRERPVFMASGPAPLGHPGMTVKRKEPQPGACLAPTAQIASSCQATSFAIPQR